MVVKNGFLGLRTLKSAVFQEWMMKWADFLHADTNLGKLKVTLIIIGWVWSKKDQLTYDSGVTHKWFDELSRLIAWFLHADSDVVIFGLTASLLHIFDI